MKLPQHPILFRLLEVQSPHDKLRIRAKIWNLESEEISSINEFVPMPN